MIRGGTLNSRARRARRSAPAAARALAGAAVGGLAVSLVAAGVPALAAQHPGGAAADQARAGATGRHTATSRMSSGALWTQIATGDFHTCGIRTGGTLWCWGSNGSGELGIGSHASPDLPSQVTTPAPGGWVSVTAGGSHTCAIRTGGMLWCWGDNIFGELGIGNVTSRVRPWQVTTPARGGWASVTAGDFQTCATRTGGTVWCWGDNIYGELGIGDSPNQDRPQQVTTPAPGSWANVTAGGSQTCGTRTGGTLWCWGANFAGELGIGNETDQNRPRQVTTPAPGGWASVTSNGVQTCGTRTSSTLWCWGGNGAGQLGIGNHTDQDRPQRVITPAPGSWGSVTAGNGYNCATRTGGTLWCWGVNLHGELGIGNETAQDRPRQVTTPAPGSWASITAGGEHTCAIRTSGTLWCWGDNLYGQLGLGNATDQNRPRQVTGCTQPATQTRAASTSSNRYRVPPRWGAV